MSDGTLSFEDKTVEELLWIAWFSPLIGGPAAYDELDFRGFGRLTREDVQNMRAACEQFHHDHR